MLEPVFPKLNREIFRNRTVEVFPNAYMTLMSIIQGVALYCLISETFKLVTKENTELCKYLLEPSLDMLKSLIPLISLLSYSIISFFMISATFFSYLFFLNVFRWPPKIHDTIIPLLIGTSQIIPMYFMGKPIWWLFLSSYFLCAIIGFRHTKKNCTEEIFDPKIIEEDKENNPYELLKKDLKGCRIYGWTGIAIALICFIIKLYNIGPSLPKIKTNILFLEIPFILIFIALFPIYLIHDKYKLKKTYEKFGLEYKKEGNEGNKRGIIR